MMQLEHRKELKKLKKHEDDKEKPTLDKQEKEMINTKLQQAIHNNLAITIKYYEDKSFKTITGSIKKTDVNKGVIFINDQKIKVENLVGIKLKQRSEVMKEYVVTAQVIGSSAGIGKITDTIMAEDKEEALEKFYEPYNNQKPGTYSRDEIEFKSIREVTDDNRDNFYK